MRGTSDSCFSMVGSYSIFFAISSVPHDSTTRYTTLGLRSDGSFRMTNDSLDYLWNPDAPADWFVKFPLKVRRADCYSFLSCLVGQGIAAADIINSFCRNARICTVSPTRESLIGPICRKS